MARNTTERGGARIDTNPWLSSKKPLPECQYNSNQYCRHIAFECVKTVLYELIPVEIVSIIEA